ncbi:MAG TPA: hypothetical protein DEQ02_09345 [Ruminococcaceae bacterium]|nr:hypothetical protein [Oscillospiraceae bacterium]
MTQSLEDYLEAIYICQISRGEVRITDIAAETGFSKPSVNRAVNTLKEGGFVEHEYYGKIRLTEKGERFAANVYERHVTLKNFLKNQLGVDEKTAEEDACRMEHVMSEQTVKSLMKYIKTIENS